MLQAYVEGLGFLPSQVVRSITATAQRALDTAKAATAAVPTGAQAEPALEPELEPVTSPQPQPSPLPLPSTSTAPKVIFVPGKKEDEEPAFYKRPVFWFAVAGVALVGAGGYLLFRRKR